MQITTIVKNILHNYDAENFGTLSKLQQILMSGKLAGTGKMLILPVDQGFEHGPDRSFAVNEESYDPDYHFKLAIESGLSAYAAPLGMIEASIAKYYGQVPVILKMNSAHSLINKIAPNQAITASVKDALRLGCIGVGVTIYPGSAAADEMIEEAREIISEAKSCGLLAVVWSYPRGENISKQGESALDICAYAAHIAALIGAHIIKVKPPTEYIEQEESKKIYNSIGLDFSTLENRVRHIVKSCFGGKRIVIFSGGTAKSDEEILNEITSIALGKGNGSIIGRNSFQRPYNNALQMLERIINIYKR